ncbi:helix-turn-helix domain-containing protein [Streptomyces chrestomyceticus]|uniref:helix-turn-helix domain-containing protein n=1 Tax=Streptomyces chrestomyceticus TaxID=68185 RepID=UPI0035A88396
MSTAPSTPPASGGLGLPKFAKRKKLTPKEKKQFNAAAAKAYLQWGASIRAISTESGRAYGSVHKALTEIGVPLRPRGGDNHPRD